MPEETKPEEKKPGQAETPPKGIEDLLKELPKVDSSRPSSPPPPQPPSPAAPLPKPPQMPAPKPSSPPPLSQPDKFKSFMRTMDEDLAAAKKGMKPESKPFEIKPPPGGALPPKPMAPPATGPKPPSPEVKLGPKEKARSLEAPKTPPPLAGQPPPVLPPRRGKFKINPRLLIIVLIVIAVFAGAWFYLLREPEEIVVSTPTASPTPTPSPLALSELIVARNQVTIPATEDFETAFNNELLNISVSAGELISLEVMDENGNRYSVSQIMDNLQIFPPQGLAESLDQNDWTLAVFGQQESFDERGLSVTVPSLIQEKRIGLVARISDSISLRSALNTWEITMTEDLKDLFGLNPQNSTSETFLDNIYNGRDIRYRNFPYADKSIDYAIVSLPGLGAEYLVMTNSRESTYSLIDLLQAQ